MEWSCSVVQLIGTDRRDIERIYTRAYTFLSYEHKDKQAENWKLLTSTARLCLHHATSDLHSEHGELLFRV